MPSWKNIPSFKAGLGSGSQKTHPHFIWCFIFFLHEPFLKDAGSLQVDNHTSQVHIKGLYLCWGKNRPRNRQRESTAKHNLCPPSSLILKAGGNNSSLAQSLDHAGPLALAGGQLGQCYVILAKTMPRSYQWSCPCPCPLAGTLPRALEIHHKCLLCGEHLSDFWQTIESFSSLLIHIMDNEPWSISQQWQEDSAFSSLDRNGNACEYSSCKPVWVYVIGFDSVILTESKY